MQARAAEPVLPGRRRSDKRGRHVFPPGRPEEKRDPLGGQRSTRSDKRGGHVFPPGRPKEKRDPLGGQRSTRSDKRGGHMARLNLLLLLAVLASALYLVRTQYESRRLYVELEKAAAESRKLETDNERLQVEKRAQATPLKVEKLAKERLQMRMVTPAITQYVTYKDATATPASAPEGVTP